jgi:hypothetical protein
VNLAATILGEPFEAWISEQITIRNQKLEVKKNLLVEMDNEVYAAFQASGNVSQ